jgi:hypothetical protein
VNLFVCVKLACLMESILKEKINLAIFSIRTSTRTVRSLSWNLRSIANKILFQKVINLGVQNEEKANIQYVDFHLNYINFGICHYAFVRDYLRMRYKTDVLYVWWHYIHLKWQKNRINIVKNNLYFLYNLQSWVADFYRRIKND